MSRFSTKGNTLLTLREHFRPQNIKPLQCITYEDWQAGKFSLTSEILSSKQVIIRSSALSEDAIKESKAGQFLSIAHINPKERECLEQAIREVFESYGTPNAGDQVIIQEQVSDIAISGVLFTADIDTLAPYFVINYDDSTGSHDSITSGTGTNLKTYVRAKCSPYPCKDNRLNELLSTATELEQFFNYNLLDIEFAIDNAGKLFILQVRPIVKEEKKLDPRIENTAENLSEDF